MVAEVQALVAFAMQTPSDVANIFVEYSPHVQSVWARVYLGGWKPDVPTDADIRVYLDHDIDAMAGLRNMKAELARVLEGWMEKPVHERISKKAAQMRETAQKLLAEAESLTAPSPSA